MKKKFIKRRCGVAGSLASSMFRKRVIKPKKGKGSFSRHNVKKELD